MPMFSLPAAAVPIDLPRDVRLQIVSPGAELPLPDDAGWLHETARQGKAQERPKSRAG